MGDRGYKMFGGPIKGQLNLSQFVNRRFLYEIGDDVVLRDDIKDGYISGGLDFTKRHEYLRDNFGRFTVRERVIDEYGNYYLIEGLDDSLKITDSMIDQIKTKEQQVWTFNLDDLKEQMDEEPLRLVMGRTGSGKQTFIDHHSGDILPIEPFEFFTLVNHEDFSSDIELYYLMSDPETRELRYMEEVGSSEDKFLLREIIESYQHSEIESRLRRRRFRERYNIKVLSCSYYHGEPVYKDLFFDGDYCEDTHNGGWTIRRHNPIEEVNDYIVKLLQ